MSYDVIIVGGGAAGLAAAVFLGRADGTHRIALLEKGPRVGKKLMATGNGTCNLTNVKATAADYHGAPRLAQAALDAEGLGHVHICPEVMGKVNQLGTLEEVLTFCRAEERFLPCVDFGHLNSRTFGATNSREAYAAVIDAIGEALGEERMRTFHIHFSKIEYTGGGEKKHLTFADETFGPDPQPLMSLLAERGLCPTVICESAGTQTVDAATMSRLYDSAAQ